MWPWEHVAFGYLLYSSVTHLWRRESPTDLAVLVLLGGTQLPDLVDKPLSWGLGLFPSGYALAHSVFVAVPVGLAVALAATRRGRTMAGVAFGVGYWSHLLGDVVNPLRGGGGLAVGAVLWPLARPAPYQHDYGLLGRTVRYLQQFASALTTGADLPLLVVSFGLVLGALALWIADGAPGVAGLRWLLGRVTRRG